MAEIKKIQERIREIAGRKKNVRLSDIEWVVNNLAGAGYKTRTVRNEHQMLFTIEGRKFSACTHRARGSQLKACYVNSFLDVMMDLGLYDD